MGTQTQVGHTPGPWKAHTFAPEEGKQHYVTAGAQDQISIARTGRWDLASAADARLIAAAPDLLAACDRLGLAAAAVDVAQHAGQEVSPEQWSELYEARHKACAVVSAAKA